MHNKHLRQDKILTQVWVLPSCNFITHQITLKIKASLLSWCVTVWLLTVVISTVVTIIELNMEEMTIDPTANRKVSHQDLIWSLMTAQYSIKHTRWHRHLVCFRVLISAQIEKAWNMVSASVLIWWRVNGNGERFQVSFSIWNLDVIKKELRTLSLGMTGNGQNAV